MTDIIEEIRRLKEQNAKYQNWIERQQEIADKLKALKESLDEIEAAINPYVRIDVGNSGKRQDRQALIEELYELMQKGTHVTTDFIMKTYSLDKNKASYLMIKLAEKPKVTKVRDGLTVRLFYDGV